MKGVLRKGTVVREEGVLGWSLMTSWGKRAGRVLRGEINTATGGESEIKLSHNYLYHDEGL